MKAFIQTFACVVAWLALLPGAAFAQWNGATPLVTFTNPTPASSDYFGMSLAAVGNDRLLIGAWADDTGATDAGAAYLFSTNGMLLAAFTNPAPAANGFFGRSVAAMGNDRVVIGASGAAYLFSLQGSLLNTFTNATPAASENFGYSVAALGNDRVIIGANGMARLFSTNGVQLTTFIVPDGGEWPRSITSVGTDEVLIGVPFQSLGQSEVGAAYLFNTNGLLLTSFTNPTPAIHDQFGLAVASLGADRVLISAPFDNSSVGAAYLFNTNGTLLTTFTNPVPVANADFGWSLTVVGNDRVFIGAPIDSTAGMSAGAAYLFNTNGALLHALTKAAPAANEFLGDPVAVMGNGGLLVGAWGVSTEIANVGAAYWFEMPYPSLSITRSGPDVFIRWADEEPGLILQASSALGSSAEWKNISEPFTAGGGTNTVQQTVNPTNHFYRLRRP